MPIDGTEDQKFLDQAQHEFRVAEMLDHPNLIKVYALETVKDWLFRVRKVHLLIEYVNGKTLDTCPRLPLPQLVQVFKCVADGLVHMHRRQVCHADLKPNNIMLSRAGEVKIIDFGLAAIKGEAKNRIQGTPEYMAPEQAKHKMVNERTDIYNFGATMYRMVTLRLPPQRLAAGGRPAASTRKTWKRLLKPVEEFNPDAPPALCDLIHRCLSFNAMNRPERMSEVQSVLDHLADELSRRRRTAWKRWSGKIISRPEVQLSMESRNRPRALHPARRGANWSIFLCARSVANRQRRANCSAPFASRSTAVYHLRVPPPPGRVEDGVSAVRPRQRHDSPVPLTADERQRRLNELFERFRLAAGAGRLQAPQPRRDRTGPRNASDWGIHMDVDFSAFEHARHFRPRRHRADAQRGAAGAVSIGRKKSKCRSTAAW